MAGGRLSCEGYFGASLGIFLGKYNPLSYHLLCMLEYSEFTWGNRPNSVLSNQHITSEVKEGFSASGKVPDPSASPNPHFIHTHSGHLQFRFSPQPLANRPAWLGFGLLVGSVMIFSECWEEVIQGWFFFLCKRLRLPFNILFWYFGFYHRSIQPLQPSLKEK